MACQVLDGPGSCKNARWYACFEYDRPVQPLARSGAVVGVDRGVHVLAALSDGTLIRNPAFGDRNGRLIRYHQRALESLTQRDKLGKARNRNDQNRKAVALRLSRAKEREANRRRDFLHKTARDIVRFADVIGLERLALRGMIRSAKGNVQQPAVNSVAKSSLNRKMLDAGFGRLERFIVEKAVEAARTVVRVDARFSSQTCSHCGCVRDESRRGRRFRCIGCGFACHADVNAALVIRRRAELQLMKGLHAGADPALNLGVQQGPYSEILIKHGKGTVHRGNPKK